MKLLKFFMMLLTLILCSNKFVYSGFTSEDITFEHPNAKLAGTLTLPDSGSNFPAIILISGSGQQNRDEEIFGFKLFKIIAEHFSNNGIAVLRYDDRGIGGSKGDVKNATTADFAEDTKAALEYLKTRTEINKKKIGLLGHSEGGIIATIVASKSNDIAFIIFMASPAFSGEKILNYQVEKYLKLQEKPDSVIQEALKLQNLVYKVAKEDKGWEELEEKMVKANIEAINDMPQEKKKFITDPEKYSKYQVKAELYKVKSNWFKFFVEYDPYEDLRKIKCPVLAVFGGLDTQVEAEPNARRMEEALNNGVCIDFLTRVFWDANHLFQEAKTGSVEEYATLKKEFFPGFIEYITGWLNHTINKFK